MITRSTFQALATITIVLTTTFGLDAQREAGSMEQRVSYRTVMVEGISIFYREAGPKEAPTILLLHGLPSSSRMFQPLLTRLADNYHLVAPDYPGFGHSDWPDPSQFDYTFDRIAAVIEDFTSAPRSSAGAYRARRGGSRQRPRSELGHEASLLGRPAGVRREASCESSL